MTPAAQRRRRLVILAVIVAGALVSGLIAASVHRAETSRIQAEFERRAQAQARLAREKLRRYEEMTLSLRDAFADSDNVPRAGFAAVARSLLVRHPGVQALEWATRVPVAARDAVEARIRGETGRPFEIRELKADGQLLRAGDRAEYLPILYVEPLAGNEAIEGYDVSNAVTRDFLGRARREKRLVVSHMIKLVQHAGGEPGVVFILPLFRPGPRDAEGFLGFFESIFLVRVMLQQAHLGNPDPALETAYVDVTPGTPPTLLYWKRADSDAFDGREPAPTLAPDYRESIALGGRTWEIRLRQLPAWAQAQRTSLPWLVFASGLFSTGLASLFIDQLLRRTGDIQREVAARTDELRRTQDLLEEDIRRRTAMEAALTTSENRLQSILDHSPNSIFVKDLEGRYVLVNRQHARLWNRLGSDFVGRTDMDLFPAAVAVGFRDGDQRVLSANAAIKYEVTVTLPEATMPTTAIVQKFPLRDAAGRVYGLCGISTDITDRKQAEAELQENRRQLSSLITQLPGAAFRCQFDEKLTALFASEGMLALTGYAAEDFVAGRMHVALLTVPADRAAVRAAVGAAVQHRRPFEVEYRLTHRDGQEKWVLVRGRPVYDETGALRFLEGLAIDVTALKLAEQEKIAIERKLLAAQKLESLGVLAGGIAHDFNNILTSVLANASLARHDATNGRSVDRSLQQIENAARRAADLCQQMLAYAGKGKIVTDRVNLSELVRGTAALLEVTLNKNTRLDLRLAGNLPPVLADLTQLRQIVMNLVINAADAITGPAGLITVTTFHRTADAALLRGALGNPDLPPGPYVGLEVSDNGSGMAPETIARIFEPFFTTKFSGRGLGLSAVLGIVQSHRGALFVESSPGRGAIFRLLLPATAGPTVPSAPPFPAPARRNMLRGVVLVVDDEEAVRNIAATVLELHGAGTHIAASGEAALDLLRTQGEKISLVLLDMTMPGIGGEETMRRMRMLGSRQPVILMSGYSEAETMQRSANLGVGGFIQKPFEIETLLAKIQPFLT